MRLIDKLAWIEIVDGKILTARSANKDKFYIPGGKRENGESDEQALIREIREELSVEIDLNTIKYFGIFEAQAHGHDSNVMVKMTCYFAKYTGQIKADSEIAEVAWLNYNEWPQTSFVDKLIFDDLNKKGLLI